jgi:hypothetical protein
MFALALVGLLISPISWTHHWVWVALIPPLVVAGKGLPRQRSVTTSLWVLFAVSVLAPYWWFSTGAAADILSDSLALAGLGVLVVWSHREYRRRLQRLTIDRETI